MTRTFVSHDVMFLLTDDDERPVVPVGYSRPVGGAWARLGAVTVHLNDDRPPTLTGSGVRCRRDGTPDGRFRGGMTISPVVVPDPESWVERAWAAVASDTERVEP